MLVQGLGGIEPNAHQHKVIISPSLPSGLSKLSFERLQMGEHTFSFSHHRQEKLIETVIRHHQGSVPLEVRFSIKNKDVNTMFVGEQKVTTTVSRHPTLGYVESSLNIKVPVGVTKKVVRELTPENSK